MSYDTVIQHTILQYNPILQYSMIQYNRYCTITCYALFARDAVGARAKSPGFDGATISRLIIVMTANSYDC